MEGAYGMSEYISNLYTMAKNVPKAPLTFTSHNYG